ncbi:E3 ubiquitin-protein ligase TRIM35-like [Lates calcarifer]|uniref:E3 ubiquitin-protein ligase TRIM35-like n=1 Tax=Lates calcarifer TaxID=8187 RepID=A0AAJ8BJ95_LATCA|nr:E3 ubiquitin-protein ligase TRIM35-like [Lates calcarifer]
MELFSDVKGNFDKTENDIEVQAQDAEKQIKDVFSMLQKFLRKEEQTRIAALREEKQQKIQMIESKREVLSDEFEGLYFSVNLTTQVLEYEDLYFLHVYRTAADIAHGIQLNDPQPTPGALIDVDKHLNNLSLNILDRMKMEVTNTLVPQTAAPESTAVSTPTPSPPSPGGAQDPEACEIPILLASIDRNIIHFSDDESIIPIYK